MDKNQPLIETEIYDLLVYGFNQHAMMRISDAEGNTVYVNDTYCERTGFTRDELIGQKHLIVHPDFHSKEFVRNIFETCLNGDIWSGELCHMAKDGSPLWVDTTITPRKDATGNYSLFLTVQTDISPQKNAEMEAREALTQLHQSEMELNLLVKSINGFFWKASIADEKFIFVSPQIENMLGYSLASWLDMDLYTALATPADRKKFDQTLSGLSEAKPSSDFVCKVRHANGEARNLRSVITGEFSHGVLQRVLGVSFDITQGLRQAEKQKSLEAQLVQSQKLESVGQLASGIAHEINTPTQFVGDNTRFLQGAMADMEPLNSAYDELLQAAGAAAFATEITEKIHSLRENMDYEFLMDEIPSAIEQSLEGVDRISRIVGAMKEFAHPGTANMEYVDINHAIKNTVTVASNEWKYTADINFQLDETIPVVECMVGEMNQVFLNIIVNAAHAIRDKNKDTGEKGLITISSRATEASVEITIADTGTGMPDSVRQKIFDPFFTTKGVGKGTGQGLSIAYSVVVDKHGGTIEVDSTENQGTTFLIRLPVKSEKKTREEVVNSG